MYKDRLLVRSVQNGYKIRAISIVYDKNEEFLCFNSKRYSNNPYGGGTCKVWTMVAALYQYVSHAAVSFYERVLF